MEYWNSWKYRREYSKIVFKPGVVDDRELNLFTGFNYKKDDNFRVEKEKNR